MRKLALVVFAGIVACGSSIDVGNGGSSGGSSSGNGGPGTAISPDGSLDGTWDITSAGGYSNGAGQMTVNGASVTGFVPQGDEGKPYWQDDPSCVVTKDRTEFTFTANGNALSGTRTTTRELTGSGCPGYPPSTSTYTVTGVRTREAPASMTALNGDWQITGQGESWTGTVNGATATGTSNSAKHVPPDTLTISFAGNMLTVSSSDKMLSFAARKR